MNRGIRDSSIEEREFLQKYDSTRFGRPSVAVDVLIFAIGDRPQENIRKLPEKELRILMLKRRDHPDRGLWALPGGFVGLEETLEQAACRKLGEKTGLRDIYLEQLYTFGDVGRDPRTRVISCAYLALVNAAQLEPVSGESGNNDAAWFSLACAPLPAEQRHAEGDSSIDRVYALILDGPEQLKAQVRTVETFRGNVIDRRAEMEYCDGFAFDHALMIWTGIERLRNKLEYTPIVFSLMPRLFTLTELQQVYETILGRDLLAANFRRKIGHLVVDSGHTRADYQHRPARLYKFDPEGRAPGL